MRRTLFAALIGAAVTATFACSETRRSNGEECLRDDDCLSGVCASRACVTPPTLTSEAGAPPPEEVPRLGNLDASASSLEGG